MPDDGTLRLLTPGASLGSRVPPSRRSVLAGAVALGGLGLLSACGGGAASPGAGSALEDELHIYTWGEYDAPSTVKDFSRKHGVKVSLDTYASNEEMIAKLVAAKGTSGYDIVVPSSYYIPGMVDNGLLDPLDTSLVPNLAKVLPAFRGNAKVAAHAACKDWGTTGYVYDNTVITRELKTWGDFLDAAQKEASGSMSMVEDPGEIVAAYFNANGIDENTTSKADYDECQTFLVNKIAAHVQAFDSYPGAGAIQQAQRALLHAWNGDARTGILASKKPQRWTWVLPSPTNRWQDNWAIPRGAPHPVAANTFINTVLDPSVSLKELTYIGYDTGVEGVADAAKAAGIEMPELVFFSEEQVATMTEGEITSMTPRQTTILNAMRAKAAS